MTSVGQSSFFRVVSLINGVQTPEFASFGVRNAIRKAGSMAQDGVARVGQVRDAFQATDLRTSTGRRVGMGLVNPIGQQVLMRRSAGQPNMLFRHEQRTFLDLGIERGDFPKIDAIYLRGENNQWNANDESVLDFKIPVDRENPERRLIHPKMFPLDGHPITKKASARQRLEWNNTFVSYFLNQSYFGEQGARAISAQLACSTLFESARQMAAQQCVDEARHVDVFGRYIKEKIDMLFDVDPFLAALIQTIIECPEPDIKFLGMQIMIEGLAMGSFGMLRKNTMEPLLRDLLLYVLKDEARHVNFGVTYLEKLYKNELTSSELQYRKELAAQLAHFMYYRFLGEGFRETVFPEVSRKEWKSHVEQTEVMRLYRKSVFVRIMNDLDKIGLIDKENPGQVERRYKETGLFDLIGQEVMDFAA